MRESPPDLPRARARGPGAGPPGAPAARIPRTRDPGWPARAVWVAPRSAFADAFRNLALRLRAQLPDERGRSLLVTSALPGEGRTLTACNLALALASFATAERVALVDLDLRTPGVGQALGLLPRAGLEAVLRGETSLEEAAVVTDAGIHVFAAATPQATPHELLARPELADAMKRLEATYRWVICDAPPLLGLPDAQLVAPHVAACLAVARAGRLPQAVLGELAERLPERTLGFFLNDLRPPGLARLRPGPAVRGAGPTRAEREAPR